MTTPARKGRRNPDLLTTVPQEIDIAVEPTEQHFELGEQPDEPLVFDGDVVTSSVTLAVLLPGDSKESYIGYKLTSRVQPGETAADVYSRVVTTVNESVVSQIDDVIDRLGEYYAELERRGAVPHA
jgi:hypothetical protein